jgi:hypothetical protein
MIIVNVWANIGPTLIYNLPTNQALGSPFGEFRFRWILPD